MPPPNPQRELLEKLAAATQTIGGNLVDDPEWQERRRVNALPWKELWLEQKCERMREIMKALERTVRWHSGSLQELRMHLDRLDEHSHADGRVMIPVVSKQSPGYGAEAMKEKVEGWF